MTPEELWGKYLAPVLGESVLRQPFKDALAEYGAAVRQRDAEICINVKSRMIRNEITGPWDACAAAISREPLP